MDTFINLGILVLYIGLMVIMGVYSIRHTKTIDGFLLGGRGLGPWLSAFAYGTSFFSAVIFIGYAGKNGWNLGISAVWIGIGNALIGCLLSWLVLANKTRVMTQKLNSRTMPEFFGMRYGDGGMKIFCAIVIFIFLTPYAASVYMGLSYLFSAVFPAVPYIWWMVIMAVLTALYLSLGGYMATVLTDFIQGIIMIIGIVFVIYFVLHNDAVGGLVNGVKQLADIPEVGKDLTSVFAGKNWFNLLSLIVLTSLGTWGLPQMVHKFYAIKSEKAIKTGTIVSTFFAIIVSGGCYFLGGFGRLFDSPAIYKADGSIVYDAIVPSMLATLPDILIGVVIVLVLSASMSTLSSLVLTSASTLTLDFIKGTIVKNMDDKKQLIFIRVLIVFFIVISVVLALNPPTFIAQLMGISWGALAGAFLAPFLYGLYWKGVTKAGVWASFICGVGITVSNMFFKFIASPINAGAAAMIVGLIVTPVVSLISPKLNKDFLDKIFKCYDETASNVSRKEYLKED